MAVRIPLFVPYEHPLDEDGVPDYLDYKQSRVSAIRSALLIIISEAQHFVRPEFKASGVGVFNNIANFKVVHHFAPILLMFSCDLFVLIRCGFKIPARP